ncbi:MAG: hypothetical protein ABI679_01755 [Gemmatimonadota bacterium]
MRSRGWVFLGGALVGLTAGWFVGQRQIAQSRNDLFSPQPLRRLSALGFLAGQVEVETVRLLRDYLSWESQPMLRRRAKSLLRRMETTLG